MNPVSTPTSSYQPGIHCIVDIYSTSHYLTKSLVLKELWDKLIEELELQKVGEVYHQFENGGFTAVVCLTESHLSIHTWPEYGYATFDIFLSNYQQVNDKKGDLIVQRTTEHLEAFKVNLQKLRR